ncbi:MAG: hypothetical protein GXP33_05670 [Spirochaetes bacterium]|nr:hypothetical protein [Spirochaetota bacterium]
MINLIINDKIFGNPMKIKANYKINQKIMYPDFIPFVYMFFIAVILIFQPSELSGLAIENEALPLSANGKSFWKLEGEVSNRYVFRTAHTQDTIFTDNDLFQTLHFDMTTPQKDNFGVHLLATCREDLDGGTNRTNFYPLEDIGDTGPINIIGKIYEANIDYDYLYPFLPKLIFGRQSGTRSEPVFFDGISASIDFFRYVIATLYGGAAVQFYETGWTWGKDVLGGIGIDILPYRSAKISLDYLFVENQSKLFLTSTRYNHLIDFAYRQRLFRWMKIITKVRFINFLPDSLEVRLLNSSPGIALETNLSYYLQFRTDNEPGNNLSQFYYILGPVYPFHSLNFKARSLITPHFAIELGFFIRALLDNQNENTFNHQYVRLYAFLEGIDLFTPGLSASLSAGRWISPANDYNSIGLDVSYRFKAGLFKPAISAGTYFSLFKYDYYLERGERKAAETYYLKSHVRIGKHFSFTCSYEYETSLENYNTLKTGLNYAF